MKYCFVTMMLLSALLASGCVTTRSNQPGPLIARQVLFGNPDRASLKISPDGDTIAFLAPRDGVMNIWVAPADDPTTAQPVTADKLRGIRTYFWAYTGEHIIYLQDLGGDENWQLHVVNIRTEEDRNLTPFEEILGPDGEPLSGPDGTKLRPQVQIQEVSHKFHDQILIGLNSRNPQFHDLHRLNILTGEMELLQQNDEFMGFQTDDDYRVRYAMKMTPDGGSELLAPNGDDGWKSFERIPMEDTLTTAPISFDKSGRTLYMIDSRGRNTAALTALDLKSGSKKVLFENPKADVSNLMVHPTEKTIEAVSSDYLRIEWSVLDRSVESDLKYLRTVADGDMEVINRSLDDQVWAVLYVMDDGPVRYYLYDRREGKARFMFTNRKALENLKLSRMHPRAIAARDGLELVSYLTLPHWTDGDGDGCPDRPLPMVLFVHGGPWARDSWGYHPYHQWLANRGYAVLSVNYRGSTGFGKQFINASNLEWAGRMHDDLIDAVNWAIGEKVADPEKVAIMGGSYGGYATLVALTFTPDRFACGVDIVGPSNLQTLLETIPPYWAPMLTLFTTRVGDHRTEEGREFLASRSPITFVEKIRKPLLIGQGANDPRVKQSESDQIVGAMEAKNIPVTYVLFPDEGHGFARPENRLSFNAVTDLFLSEHLGGRSEPIGDDFEGSSITVPKGAEHIPTVEPTLNRR
jgi:dipeptidyl aminopeptidase/acylaminoacyl peptidase